MKKRPLTCTTWGYKGKTILIQIINFFSAKPHKIFHNLSVKTLVEDLGTPRAEIITLLIRSGIMTVKNTVM